jgi:hypothetical protein
MNTPRTAAFVAALNSNVVETTTGGQKLADFAALLEGENIRLRVALKAIHDEADHALGTEAKNPDEIHLSNLREIRRLAKLALGATK